MTTTDERLEALEARARHLEDIVSIQRLVALYGPAVDSNSLTAAAAIWDPDGAYTVHPGSGGPTSTDNYDSRAAIEAMLNGPHHQGQIATGCAHIMTAPIITIDGDTATAVCYLTLVNHSDGSFAIARQSANRWDLERGPQGWKITRRATSLMDGRDATVDMVHTTLSDIEASGALFGTGRVGAT
jgi:SnoaL-like domain